MRVVIFVIVLLGLSGCSNTKSMSAEFETMDDCLSAIKNNSGHELEIITDKLGDISGSLVGTKLGFGCKTEATGTKGLIVKGWYEVNE